MSIAMNAETGQPLGRDLTPEEEAAQEAWKADREAKRKSRTKQQRTTPVKHRAGTAERVERRAFYGKYNPANGVCPECHMIITASGACTGCY